jgi:hypothetical protein
MKVSISIVPELRFSIVDIMMTTIFTIIIFVIKSRIGS